MEEYFDIPNLKLAWERCLRDTNRDVKDYAGIDLFGFCIEENLMNLSKVILKGDYKPSRPAKFYEPKPTGTQRSKTILCIEDAIVYQCIIDTIATRAYQDTAAYGHIQTAVPTIGHENRHIGHEIQNARYGRCAAPFGG